MSERSELAERLAAKIKELKLTNPYGGDVGQLCSRGKPYAVGFSRPKDLDGELSVYDLNFIRFKFLARSQGQQSFVVESEEHAIAVIVAIANSDWRTLSKISRKPPGARVALFKD